ncbi:hypothetical protein EDB19DRAFT_709901 [Suillus lakei]|nr:hypothetical protein EDB19DRAFT_709901 [Suillus lakei]
MEVSLYSQAIERVKQYQTREFLRLWDADEWSEPSCFIALARIDVPTMHEIRMPLAMSKKEVVPSACSIATQQICEAWLTRNEAHLIPAAAPFIDKFSPLDDSTPSVLDQFATAQEENPKSAVLNHITPSLPLLSTCVTARAQEAFYEAFKIEQTSQVKLMAKSHANKRDSVYMHNLERDLFTLEAKMRRAEAEIELYTLAIENTHEFNFSDNSSSTSSDQSIPRPLSEYRHDEDVNDDTDEDYHFW